MATIKESDKRILETLFEMQGGYVLDFSDATFQQFFWNNFKININDQKYTTYGNSKAKRLRAFWDTENNHVVGKVIIELIDVSKSVKLTRGKPVTDNETALQNKAEFIANNLLGIQKNTAKNEETVDDFLNKEFAQISLDKLKIDSSVINILNSRISEINNSIKTKSALSCIILCGSVLEGILLGVASSKAKEFNQCEISPKNRDTQKVLQFNDWTLSNFIDVSYKLGFLGLDVKKYSHSLRDFRNYIHPYEQMSSGFNPDIETAKISWQVLRAAITDLSKNV
jgi:hypothetical protein